MEGIQIVSIGEMDWGDKMNKNLQIIITHNHSLNDIDLSKATPVDLDNFRKLIGAIGPNDAIDGGTF